MSVKGEKEMESISIGTLFKFIKPFDGSREKLSSFLSICQSAIDLATSSQKPILLKFIQSQLLGKAEIACSIKDFDDWDQLSEFLKSQFGETKHYAHLLSDLQDCHQLPQEMVSQFALRVETCLSKLITEITLSNKKKSELAGRLAAMDDLALHTFLLGLKPGISNLVRGKNPQNLNSAIDFATAEEKIQKLMYKRHTPSSQNVSMSQRPTQFKPNFRPIHNLNTSSPNQFQVPICRYCKNQGHTIENCKKREYNNAYNIRRQPPQFSTKPIQYPQGSTSTQHPQRPTSSQFQQRPQNSFNRKPFNGRNIRVHFVNDDHNDASDVPNYALDSGFEPEYQSQDDYNPQEENYCIDENEDLNE